MVFFVADHVIPSGKKMYQNQIVKFNHHQNENPNDDDESTVVEVQPVDLDQLDIPKEILDILIQIQSDPR